MRDPRDSAADSVRAICEKLTADQATDVLMFALAMATHASGMDDREVAGRFVVTRAEIEKRCTCGRCLEGT